MDPSLLPSLAWFVHIAEHRSFTKAAAEMGVSRAALSQNLKTLEQRLDTKLIYRTTRDMSLTEEGQRLFDVARPALGDIERALRRVGEASEEPSGMLRVNAPRVVARHLIEPYVAEFLGRYPKLKLELVMDDGISNIIADGCDAGIRLGESLAEHMIAVPITPMLKMVVAGSPSYLERHGEPASPADLSRHNCLCYRHTFSNTIYQWEFTLPDIEDHSFDVQPQGSLTTNDDDGMVRAALQGIGLVQHMNLALREYLNNGSLVPVLQEWTKPFPGFYLYAPSREQMPAKVRALIDFLVEKREPLAAELAD